MLRVWVNHKRQSLQSPERLKSQIPSLALLQGAQQSIEAYHLVRLGFRVYRGYKADGSEG